MSTDKTVFRSRTYWIVFVAWMLGAMVLLGVGLFSFTPAVANETPAMVGERRMFSILGMQIIGFPTATLVPWIAIDLGRQLGIWDPDAQSSVIGFLKDWAILAVLGALQWFVLLPWLYRLMKRGVRKSGTSA
jgi:hypothetical protein